MKKSEMKQRSKSILFVCMGNICRSPLAEGVLRHYASEAGGTDVDVDSAATHAYHVGEPPDTRAIAAARRRGIDIANLRARVVVADDFQRFDLIVAMDRENRSLLQQQVSGPGAKLELLMHYAGESDADVPDPYYGDDTAFEHALDLIEAGVRGLIKELRDTR